MTNHRHDGERDYCNVDHSRPIAPVTYREVLSAYADLTARHLADLDLTDNQRRVLTLTLRIAAEPSIVTDREREALTRVLGSISADDVRTVIGIARSWVGRTYAVPADYDLDYQQWDAAIERAIAVIANSVGHGAVIGR